MKQNSKKHPKLKANRISLITFWYTIKIFVKGFNREFEENDLYDVVDKFDSKSLGNDLKNYYRKKKNFRVFKFIWNFYGYYYITLGLLKIFASAILLILQPYAIGKVVSYFAPNQTSVSKYNVCLYAILLIVLNTFKAIYENHYDLLLLFVGLKIKTAISSLIYRQTLYLKTDISDNISTGKVITLLTKDVHSFVLLMRFANEIWISLVKGIVITLVVYNKAGYIGLLGVLSYVVYMPIQGFMINCVFHLRTKLCQRSDFRLKLIQETLSSVKFVKMFNLENVFEKKVFQAKEQETRTQFYILFNRLAVLVLGNCSKYTSLLVLLSISHFSKYQITSETIFFVLTCYRTLTESISTLGAAGLVATAEAMACAKRIESLLKDMNTTEKIIDSRKTILETPKINLTNVTLHFDNKTLLNNINLSVIKKGINIITGPTGSGKTSLLKTILQCYQIKSGTIEICGTISYASQKPWLFPGTIKQNILLWDHFDEERYYKVLNLCDLSYDLKFLPYADNTILEDCAVNLSKGQQMRITLARALYKKSDIYLLDDCLTNLDGKVSEFIFKECLLKFLSNKIVIFVTHKTSSFKFANHVFCLSKNGILKDIVPDRNLTDIPSLPKIEFNNCGTDIDKVDETTKLLEKNKEENNIFSENKKNGKVSLKIYQKYFQYGGHFIIYIVIITIYLLSVGTTTYTDNLVSRWANLEDELYLDSNNSFPNARNLILEQNNFFIIYSIMVLSVALIDWLKMIIIFVVARKITMKLHAKMFGNIINATLHFFDDHFLGNILNRFCKDFRIVDEDLCYEFYILLSTLSTMAGIIFLIINVNIFFLVPSTILLIILSTLRFFYIQTGRNLKRLELSTASPVFGHMNSTIEGLTTIKSFSSEATLIKEFDRHLNQHVSASYTYHCVVKAFTFACDIICVLFLTAIIITFLLSDVEQTSSGSVGLALTQAAMLMAILETGIQQWANMETEMTSVERLLEYTDIKTEIRSGLEVENLSGKIVFKNVSLSYTNNDLVLNQISFECLPQEKVAIVGRTGAGKSSIISCLFRLYNFEGKIMIGDTDIKTLSLNCLRTNISIISQDIVTFSGTLRQNIDPFQKYTDIEIWSLLDLLQMKSFVTSLEMAFDEKTFSLGQKQLISIARALIKKCKILIIDEATSSLDPLINGLIYYVLEKYFPHITVLLITHRLNSIQKCNKVLVLSKGQVVEFGEVQELLKLKESYFYEMMQKDEIQNLKS